jgi:hypothetical protein
MLFLSSVASRGTSARALATIYGDWWMMPLATDSQYDMEQAKQVC